MQPAPTQRPPLRVPFFYGWVIVAVCFIATFFAGATAQLFTAIMVIPISGELGWTRTEMAGALTVGVALTAVLGTIFGPLADRYGPRPLISWGAIVVAGGFFALAGMTELWHFYLAYGIGRAVAQSATSGVVTSTALTNWFVRRRGRAMGIMGMAFQFSNTLLIPLAQFIAVRWSWRLVYGLLGAGSVLFVIAPAALLLRRRPEDLGLEPDGGAVAVEPGRRPPKQDSPHSFTVKEALRTQAFWLLLGAEFLTAFVSGSLTFNLPAHFADMGLSAEVTAASMSLFAFASGFASTIWGMLSERFSERLLAIIATLLGSGLVLFMIGVSSDLAALALCALYGLTARGEHSVLTLLLGRYFGRGSFGAIRGAMGPLGYVSLGMGPLVGSIAFDHYGTFAGFLVALAVCHALTAGLLVLARAPAAPPQIATARPPEPGLERSEGSGSSQ